MESDTQGTHRARDRRLFPRYLAHERALVAVADDRLSLPYNLIDISEGGMAFHYLNSSPLPLSDTRRDI
jgi:hypothetical protein